MKKKRCGGDNSGQDNTATVFPQIVFTETVFFKVENVETFIQFPNYGNFLIHKLNNCRGNYSKGGLFKEGNYCGNTVCALHKATTIQ